MRDIELAYLLQFQWECNKTTGFEEDHNLNDRVFLLSGKWSSVRLFK